MFGKIVDNNDSKDLYLKYYRQEVARIKRFYSKAMYMQFYIGEDNKLEFFIPEKD